MAPLAQRRFAAITSAVAALAGAGVLATSASATPAATRTCHGLAVTVKASRGTVVGTSGRDVIALTGPGTVYAGRGRDIICGSPDNDVIHAGPGDDVVVGRQGHDTIDGGPGADHLYGEQGRDHLIGGTGPDILMGGSGSDRVERGGGRGAHEAQTGDSVVPGDMGISIVTDAASRTDLLNNLEGFGTAWVLATPTLRVSSAGIIAPPLANTIAFERSYSVWAMPYVPVGIWQPGAQLSDLVYPSQPVPVPGEVVVTSDDFGETVHVQQVANTTGQPGIVVRNTTIAQAFGGLQMNASTNGERWPTAPVQAFQLLPYFAFPVTPPTSVDLYVANWGLVFAGTVLPPIPQPSIRIDFGGASEVAAVSYSTQGGFIRD